MDDDQPTDSSDPGAATSARSQGGAAERALAEAEIRRAERKRADQSRPREIDGRQGPEPLRYGDWENKGIACDF